ncbi:MAG: hypothetical protein ACHQAY_27510 [Hyphomicrobiales bacterium]
MRLAAALILCLVPMSGAYGQQAQSPSDTERIKALEQKVQALEASFAGLSQKLDAVQHYLPRSFAGVQSLSASNPESVADVFCRRLGYSGSIATRLVKGEGNKDEMVTTCIRTQGVPAK